MSNNKFDFHCPEELAGKYRTGLFQWLVLVVLALPSRAYMYPVMRRAQAFGRRVVVAAGRAMAMHIFNKQTIQRRQGMVTWFHCTAAY